MNILKQNKKIFFVVFTTLVLTATIVYFNVYKFYGYKVSIGNNTVTFVKSKKEFNKTYNKLQSDIKSKYKNSTITNDFILSKVKVEDDDMFTRGNDLKKIMQKKFNIVVDVYLMKSDNRKMAYVTSKLQGKEVISYIKNYYYKKADLDKVSKVDITNNITYQSVKVKISNLDEITEIAKEVIKYNNSNQSPLLEVKVVGNIVKNEIISPITVMKSSNKIMEGVNKVSKQGVDGMKKVTTEETFLNNNKILKKVVGEKVTKIVQNKEVYIGTNSPGILKLASVNSPSRGSISSTFGTRWGKMHEGIDIAANFGSAINAALDGSITYAAWESGYGNVIKINHGEGIETTYAHCSVINVKKGDLVKKGMKIGEVGSTGHSTGPHLHFEVRKDGNPQDPQKYIK